MCFDMAIKNKPHAGIYSQKAPSRATHTPTHTCDSHVSPAKDAQRVSSD